MNIQDFINIYKINLTITNVKTFLWLIFFAFIILLVYIVIVDKSKSRNIKNRTTIKTDRYKLVHYQEAELLERAVFDSLSLNYSNYVNCVNILLESNNYTTQIDNLLITSKAIYCVECKDYVGSIGVYEYGQKWYQNLGDESYEIYNPIKQNSTHINFLTNNLKSISKLPRINIIVFSDECTLKNDKIRADNVHVIYKSELTRLIKSYEMILKDKISHDVLINIKDQLIELDHFSLEKIQEHIEGIKRRNNLDE